MNKTFRIQDLYEPKQFPNSAHELRMDMPIRESYIPGQASRVELGEAIERDEGLDDIVVVVLNGGPGFFSANAHRNIYDAAAFEGYYHDEPNLIDDFALALKTRMPVGDFYVTPARRMGLIVSSPVIDRATGKIYPSRRDMAAAYDRKTIGRRRFHSTELSAINSMPSGTNKQPASKIQTTTNLQVRMESLGGWMTIQDIAGPEASPHEIKGILCKLRAMIDDGTVSASRIRSRRKNDMMRALFMLND